MKTLLHKTNRYMLAIILAVSLFGGAIALLGGGEQARASASAPQYVLDNVHEPRNPFGYLPSDVSSDIEYCLVKLVLSLLALPFKALGGRDK